jgi:hypothetical protein
MRLNIHTISQAQTTEVNDTLVAAGVFTTGITESGLSTWIENMAQASAIHALMTAMPGTTENVRFTIEAETIGRTWDETIAHLNDKYGTATNNQNPDHGETWNLPIDTSSQEAADQIKQLAVDGELPTDLVAGAVPAPDPTDPTGDSTVLTDPQTHEPLVDPDTSEFLAVEPAQDQP